MFRDLCAVLSGACSGLLSVIPLGRSDLEGIMAQRRIGQEALRFGMEAERQTSLDALHALFDFAPADRALAGLYPSAKGEKAWPPLATRRCCWLPGMISPM
jgi:hypothetical protein